MIRSISIEGLFGEENKNTVIDFNEDLTILVGKNGSGKTTILNILNAIFNSSYYDLLRYTFNKIEITFDDFGLIVKRFNKRVIVIRSDWREVLTENSIDTEVHEIITEEDFDRIEKSIENMTSIKNYLFHEINKEHEENMFNHKRFDFKIQSLYFPTYRRTEIDFSELLWDLQEFAPRNNKYFRDKFMFQNQFINNRFENTVVGISNKDIEEIVKNEWIKISNIETQKLNSLISDFFFSFLEINSESDSIDLKTIDAKELNDQIKQIFKKTGLAKIGMNSWASKIDDYTSKIIKAQGKTREMGGNSKDEDDLEKLLEHFSFVNSISHSIGKIKDIINIYNDACSSIESIKSPFKDLEKILTEFFYPKRAFIEDGELYFKKGIDKLNFEDLSAGEKQLATLFVYSGLAAKDNSIIIIDEPELSLHVTWQRNIIRNLLSNKKRLQYIISTHSPFVISGYDEHIKVIGEYDYDQI